VGLVPGHHVQPLDGLVRRRAELVEPLGASAIEIGTGWQLRCRLRSSSTDGRADGGKQVAGCIGIAFAFGRWLSRRCGQSATPASVNGATARFSGRPAEWDAIGGLGAKE